jgi:GAF domain-containing protein
MTSADALQAMSGQLARGELTSAQFLQGLVRHMSAKIGCSRAGVWFYVDAGEARVLRCAAMYDAMQGRMIKVRDIQNAEVGAFHETLVRDGCVLAPDARAHPALAPLRNGYIDPLDIRSQMAIGLSVNGALLGIFSCEQVGTGKAWTPRQLQALRQLGSHASLSLMRAASAVVDTAPGALWEASHSGRLTTLRSPLDLGEI